MAPMTKKRRLNPTQQQEEITFDLSSRQDYLTGFHKRKEARKQHARELAVRRDKEEKVQERKQLREQRKVDLEKHVREFNEELRKQNPELEAEAEPGGWEGFGDGEGEGEDAVESDGVGEDEEYVDEDKYTTVTVEPMGLADDEDDEAKAHASAKAGEQNSAGDAASTKKRPWPSTKTADGKAKPKKKKFRYESKAERQVTRRLQNKKSRASRARREKEKAIVADKDTERSCSRLCPYTHTNRGEAVFLNPKLGDATLICVLTMVPLLLPYEPVVSVPKVPLAHAQPARQHEPLRFHAVS